MNRLKGEHLLPHNPNRTKAETKRLLTERDRVIKQFNIAIEKQSGGRKSRRKRKSRKGRKSRRKRKSRKGRK